MSYKSPSTCKRHYKATFKDRILNHYNSAQWKSTESLILHLVLTPVPILLRAFRKKSVARLKASTALYPLSYFLHSSLLPSFLCSLFASSLFLSQNHLRLMTVTRASSISPGLNSFWRTTDWLAMSPSSWSCKWLCQITHGLKIWRGKHYVNIATIHISHQLKSPISPLS